MGEFAWISWEAFATLATGIAAVIAAAFVGLRQAKILERQVEIQEAQTAIQDRQVAILERQLGVENLRVRHDLFDERMRVYESFRAWLSDILVTGRVPPSGSALEVGMADALDRSRFLFGPDVHPALERVRKLSVSLEAHHNRPSWQRIDIGLPGRGPARDYEGARLMNDLKAAHASLSDIFGREMGLSTPGAD